MDHVRLGDLCAMGKSQTAISKLAERLNELKAEGWPETLPEDVARLVQDAWPHLEKQDRSGLSRWKLTPDRMENPGWEPPLLTLRIERHGGTVMGSTRAEVHEWHLNLQEKTAEMARRTHRQVRPMGPRYSADEDCRKVVELIVAEKKHDWLKWSADKSKVLVRLGMIVPGNCCRQTSTGRRKRFRAKLVELLKEHGWAAPKIGTGNTYTRTPSQNQ